MITRMNNLSFTVLSRLCQTSCTEIYVGSILIFGHRPNGSPFLQTNFMWNYTTLITISVSLSTNLHSPFCRYTLRSTWMTLKKRRTDVLWMEGGGGLVCLDLKKLNGSFYFTSFIHCPTHLNLRTTKMTSELPTIPTMHTIMYKIIRITFDIGLLTYGQ